MKIQNIRCEIYCQKSKKIRADIPADSKVWEEKGVHIKITEKDVNGCQLGHFCLNLENVSFRENDNLSMEHPVRVYLQTEELPEKITAMYLYNEWWTRPAFEEHFQQIPSRTQVAFFKFRDHYVCMVPMVGREFKSYLTSGTDTEICLEMTAGIGGQKDVDEPLYIMASAPGLYEAVDRVFSWLAEYKGIRTRSQRRLPEMFRYLGWCSWDAFYRDITEGKVRQKAQELSQKKVPVKWMLMDDGWLSAEGEQLCDFLPDTGKFPHGFKPMIEDIKQECGIRWFGVWHALAGYWGGISSKSALYQQQLPFLCQTVNGRVIPSPQTGERFYQNWYEMLRREEIDFVKVDGQSSLTCYVENSFPISSSAREIHHALEGGAQYMDGAIINCMGMAMENILSRPTSALSRNSDDFCPNKEDGFAEHLLQNAYNAVYHDQLYYCDWDMFWTKHPDARKHSLLRAISGGPVYISDPMDTTEPDILRPLVYPDGKILMMDRAAKPTEDCMFSDPVKSGVLKLQNFARWGENGIGGGIAVFNLTKQEQPFTFCLKAIPELKAYDTCWAFDYFGKKALPLNREDSYTGVVEPGGYGWFVLLPRGRFSTCLGLLDKYVGFTAVESICVHENTEIMVLSASGTLGWLSERNPQMVWVNGVNVTQQVQKNENLYLLPLPETQEKTVLSVVW